MKIIELTDVQTEYLDAIPIIWSSARSLDVLSIGRGKLYAAVCFLEELAASMRDHCRLVPTRHTRR